MVQIGGTHPARSTAILGEVPAGAQPPCNDGVRCAAEDASWSPD